MTNDELMVINYNIKGTVFCEAEYDKESGLTMYLMTECYLKSPIDTRKLLWYPPGTFQVEIDDRLKEHIDYSQFKPDEYNSEISKLIKILGK